MIEIDELEAVARQRLPEAVASYYAGPPWAGGVDEDVTAWSRFRFRPRVLRDTTGLDLATTVLGTPVRSPLLIAPMAMQRAAHPEGEAGTAAVAHRLGSLLGISFNTGVPFAEINAAQAPWWFQVYVMDERSVTDDLVRAAVDHGASAVVLTADIPVTDPRRPDTEPRSWTNTYGMLANVPPERIETLGLASLRGARVITPATISELAELSGLPVVVKGVLRADDARICVEAGAAGVVVSTHGGRRLHQSVSSAEALREVVEAVEGRAEVYVDSGLRNAEHAAVALCLGARAVFLGRPVLWALAEGGPERVEELLTDWNRELAVVLQQLGVGSLDDVGPDLLA